MKDKIKKLNKTKTIILENIYNCIYSYYSYETSNSKFIDACLQLAEEFPDTFELVSFSIVNAKIKMKDDKLEHVFDLYKYNEDKLIYKVKSHD